MFILQIHDQALMYYEAIDLSIWKCDFGKFLLIQSLVVKMVYILVLLSNNSICMYRVGMHAYPKIV